MAVVTVAADASIDASTAQFAPQIPDGIAGEDIVNVGAPCYIDNTTGNIFNADGTAANQKAVLAGFAARPAKSGQPVTLFGVGTRFRYCSVAQTPGIKLFIAATPGKLDTVATTGDAVGVAQVLPNGIDIRVTRAI